MGRTTKKKSSSLRIPFQKPPDQHATPNFFTLTDQEKLQAINKEKIVFSFRFFDRFSEQAFNCGGTKDGWFVALLDQLRSLSELNIREFKGDPKRREYYRFHPHDWKKLKYKFNLPDEFFEQIESHCGQFAISTANGRVHGFLIFNTFFIVWLDPHHNLYPMDKHGGTKIFPQPITPFEELVIENENLRKEKEILERELYECLEEHTKPD